MANAFLGYYHFNTEIAFDCTTIHRAEKKSGEYF